MTNWAWENKDALDYSSGEVFAGGYFAALTSTGTGSVPS